MVVTCVEDLDPMDLKSANASSVLTETAPIKNSRPVLRSHRLPCSSPSAAFSHGLYLTVTRKKILDDVRSSALLDAMKSSSPPPKMIMKDINNELIATDPDVSYQAWMLKYPSALLSFERFTNSAKGKRIVLFLDYDGTLSPIVDNPDHAIMSESMRDAVRKAANCFPTAIISGRSRDKVFEFVGLSELYYAGSHGMDIMGPVTHFSFEDQPNSTRSTDKQGKEVNLFQPARGFLVMIEKVLQSLIEATAEIDGVKVENNKFCVSVHYRNVNKKDWEEVAERVNNILKDYPNLQLTHGRKVLEVRPVINWDKGKAVMFLLESLGLEKSEDVLPIYIGDDRTDEDAFKVLREGNRGYGILVSSVPKESTAYYSLRDPTEIMLAGSSAGSPHIAVELNSCLSCAGNGVCQVTGAMEGLERIMTLADKRGMTY